MGGPDDTTIFNKLYYGAVIALASVLGLEYTFGQGFEPREQTVAAIFIVAVTAALLLAPLLHSATHRHKLSSVILVNGITFAVVAFLLPLGSPITLGWFIAIYVSEKLLSRTGLMISVSVLLSSFVISVLINSFEFSDLLAAFAIGGFIAGVSFVLSQKVDMNTQDRTVLTTSIEKAQFERQRLIMLINSMGDGVIATDEQGCVKLYNGAALEIIDTNQTLDDHDIRGILKLHDKDDNEVDYIGEVQEANRNVQRRDLMLKFNEHDFKNIFTNITPIKLSFRNNSEKGYIMIIRDITKIKSLEEERDEFISVVSHELRTPITISEGNISNAMLVAEKNKVDEKILKSLNVAHDQVIFLAGMMNDLSMLSRAENNSIADDLEEVSVAEVGQTLHKSYISDAGQKGLGLRITNNTPDDLMVLSNKLYLLEILQNFITNSIKYTKEGYIEIIINQKAESDEVEFVVKDTGIGISKSDQQKIFDKFFRSEDFRTRESGGTGLGLFITVKLAKKIKARIDVDSEIDKGSTFAITIPRILEADDED